MKNRYVSPARNFDAKCFALSFALKVKAQPLAQLNGIIADNVVIARIVRCSTTEHSNANLLLSEFAGPVQQVQLTNVEQKLRQKLRSRELIAGRNSLCELPARIANEMCILRR